MTWAALILRDYNESELPAPVRRTLQDYNEQRKAAAEERLKRLFQLIQRGYAHPNLLAQFFPDSNDRMIRRDIDELIDRKLVSRHKRSYLIPEKQIFVGALVVGTDLPPVNKRGRKPMDPAFIEKCVIDAIKAGKSTFTEILVATGLNRRHTRAGLDAQLAKGAIAKRHTTWAKHPYYVLVPQ